MDGVSFIVYDKAGTFQRLVVPKSSSTTLLRNGISFSELTLDSDHVALEAATAKGARCAMRFRGREWLRGRVSSTPGHGPDGDTVIRVEDDVRKLWAWLGWPKPSAALNAQTDEYARYSGPAESVVKAAIAANVTRLGVPWTVAPSLGRGPTSKAELRFHPLGDKLMPVLDAAGLVLTLAHDGLAVTVDVRASQLVAGLLSDLTGNLEAYSWTKEAPTSTRVIVGGRGEGVEREFYSKVDAATESDWGDVIETFVDARNAEVGGSLEPDADEALAEGRATAGISMDLVESDRFRLGTHFLIGDRVRVKVGPLDQEEPITQVVIDDTPDGVVVTPKLGTADDDPDVQIGNQIAALARGARDEKRR